MSKSPTTNQNRNLALDVLRVIGALAVVLLHASARVVAIHPDPTSASWWVANFLDASTRWSVPIFIMISGALMLNAQSISWLDFYRRRYTKLLPVIGFWTVFYVVTDSYRDPALYGALVILRGIILGAPHAHLWYLYMLVGLYAATPFIKIFVSTASKEQLLYFLAFCFSLGSIETIFSSLSGTFERSALVGRGTFLSSFLPYVGYFVAGYYLQRYAPKPSNTQLIRYAATSVMLISFGVGLLFPVLGENAWILMYSYLNPLVIILSCSVYILASRLELQSLLALKFVRLLAPLTLGIYVIHPIWLSVTNKLLSLPIIGIPVTAIIVFLLSSISAWVISQIPLLKRTI